jgi:site-specific DNA recombinase
MRHKKAHGERVGTIPYGYQVGANSAHLEGNQQEQAVLATVRELRKSGYTTRQIADALNSQGFATRRSGAWRFQYVAELLKLPVAA